METNQKRSVFTLALFLSCLPAVMVCCSRVIHRRDDEINRQFISLLAQAPEIRVGLARETAENLIISEGPVRVLDHRGKVLARYNHLPRGSVRLLSSGAISIGTLTCVKKWFTLKPEEGHDGVLKWKGRRYAGVFHLYPDKGKMTLVNEVNLEQYIAGLLPHELPHNFVLEAVKAQAVAARSYALYKMNVKPRDSRYHILPSTSDQVYRGLDGIRTIHKEAVVATCGYILSYNFKFFKTFYHSTCGGHTSNLKNALDMKTIPPLQGQVCGYCKSSRFYRWRHTIDDDELIRALAARGVHVKSVSDIQPEKPGQGGHSAWLDVIDGEGVSHRVHTDGFRRKLGTTNLLSSSFRVTFRGNRVRFDGAGWGHGVGMCQMGANGMARAGMGYRRILNWYYNQAQIKNTYSDTSTRITSPGS